MRAPISTKEVAKKVAGGARGRKRWNLAGYPDSSMIGGRDVTYHGNTKEPA